MSFLSVKLMSSWRRIVHPKYETFHMLAIYSIATLTGIFGTIFPPESTQLILGPNWMTTCTVILTVGGVLGLIGTPYGDRWAERPGLLFIVGSVTIYIGTIIESHIQSDGIRYLQLGMVVMLFLFLSKRFWKIRKGRVDPLSVR